MKKVIAYIDAFNLYYGLRHKYGNKYLWLDIPNLVKEFLLPRQRLVAVKYFTARITGDPGKKKRQNLFLDVLSLNPLVEIQFGHYLYKKLKCNSCNSTIVRQKEKQTDVKIAVTLLEDARKNHFDTAFLVSGDSDLLPPVEIIRKEYPEKRIVAVFPPKRVSFHLKTMCHAYIVLGRRKLKNNLFPENIILPNGIVLEKPVKWS